MRLTMCKKSRLFDIRRPVFFYKKVFIIDTNLKKTHNSQALELVLEIDFALFLCVVRSSCTKTTVRAIKPFKFFVF